MSTNSTDLLITSYVIGGTVALVLALPKWREVFWRSETRDTVFFVGAAFLTVVGWPVVTIAWSLAIGGRWLGGHRD